MRALSVDTIKGVCLMRVARRRWWWPFSVIEEEWFTKEEKQRCRYYMRDWHPPRHHGEWYHVKSGKLAGCFFSFELEDLWSEAVKVENLRSKLSAGLDERIKELDVN